MLTNFQIKPDSGAPSGYSLATATTDCYDGVVIVKNKDASNSLTKVGVVTLGADGKPVTYEIKTLAADSEGNSLHFTSIDDSVATVEVYLDATWDPSTGMSGTQISDSSGATTQFAVVLSYGNVVVQADGTPARTLAYMSTNSQVVLNNELSSIDITWAWSLDSTLGGTVSAGMSTIQLTAGNGTLTLTWNDGSPQTLSIPVYDMTGNTATVTGPESDDCQPFVVTPNATTNEVVLYNASTGTATAYFLGTKAPSRITANAGEAAVLSTAGALYSWYLKWDLEGDPKIIVRRPATITG